MYLYARVHISVCTVQCTVLTDVCTVLTDVCMCAFRAVAVLGTWIVYIEALTLATISTAHLYSSDNTIPFCLCLLLYLSYM